jgi:hypothetical protein
MIGQIGTAKTAARFLASLSQNSDIARTTLVTSGMPPCTLSDYAYLYPTEKLDDAFKDYKENNSKLDKWVRIPFCFCLVIARFLIAMDNTNISPLAG